MKAVKEFCKEAGITEAQFYGKKKIEGSLDLDSKNITIVPKGFKAKITKSLKMDMVTKISQDFSPTVDWSLFMDSATRISQNFSPIIGWNLSIGSIKETPINFAPIVGKNLDLFSVTSFSAGFNPIVGGSIYMPSAIEGPKGFTRISRREKIFIPKTTLWLDRGYIKRDGHLVKVIKCNQNVYEVIVVGKKDISILITDGENWSLGKTLSEAKAGLLYKIANHDTSMFRYVTMDTILSIRDSIRLYRKVTDSCESGVREFVGELPKDKKKYTIAEIIELTKGYHKNKKFIHFIETMETIKSLNITF